VVKLKKNLSPSKIRYSGSANGNRILFDCFKYSSVLKRLEGSIASRKSDNFAFSYGEFL
jgi:hypothetical protein